MKIPKSHQIKKEYLINKFEKDKTVFYITLLLIKESDSVFFEIYSHLNQNLVLFYEVISRLSDF